MSAIWSPFGFRENLPPGGILRADTSAVALFLIGKLSAIPPFIHPPNNVPLYRRNVVILLTEISK